MHRATMVTLLVGATMFDHLACYVVKDPVRKGRSTLTLTNAGVTQSCTIGSRAQLGCLETQISMELRHGR
jgi:hypothetical protein